jgi:coronin-2
MLDRSECQKPERRMTFRGIRSSKFRHVYGSPAKRQKCYENVKITKSTHDSNLCAINPKFIAVVVEVGGGGSFIVLPLNETGRVGHHASKVSGHSRPVSDIKWNPFNDNIIASGSEDCTIKLWYIPDGGLQIGSKDLTDYLIELQGHRRRVTLLEWHPTAENVLLSAGYDHRIIVWNISKGQAVNYIDCHTDVIYSMSFNRNGSLLTTTSKDKKLRVIDPRSTECLRKGDSHYGTKASKAVYLGDTGKIFTTGFSRYNDREYAVWSQHDLSSPLERETIDSSSGVLYPFYDHDTRIIYVAGKGDGNVRYYEVADDDEKPHVFYLSQFISGAPQRGFGVLPKRGCDTTQCEIFRFYKLHATRELVEPISMIVPRKSEIFQEDIYPETAAPSPALTAEEWLAGKNATPIQMSMRAGTRIRTYKPVVYKPSENAVVASDKINDRKFMFLSEETKPDYRPIDRRSEIRPSPQIDHRPLGADSYNTSLQTSSLNTSNSSEAKLSHEKRDKTNRNLGTKFQEVQRKWGGLVSPPPSGIFSDNGDFENDFASDYRPPKSPKFITGSSTVKCLSNRFDGTNKELDSLDGLSLETTADILKQAVGEQKREIDTLRAQLSNKDAKIRQLEETLNRITGSVHNSNPPVSSESSKISF